MSTVVESSIEAPVAVAGSAKPTWHSVVASPAFWPGMALLVGFLLAYLPLATSLWPLWTSGDGYYSHGLLVPPIIAFIIARRWQRIKDTPVRPAMLALVPVLVLTWVAMRAGSAGINMIMAAALVGTLVFGTAFVAGWRWMLALMPATLYSVFALPFWSAAIDAYTNPLQILSTKVAFQLLKLLSYSLYVNPSDPTTIVMNNFTLNVAVPCSGLKLVLALSAFVTLFVLIARLRHWANLLLVASILPMALFFNGLRIAMIGMVGNAYGTDAAAKFHDYSGYITLAVCFYALFKFARGLGWKD